MNFLCKTVACLLVLSPLIITDALANNGEGGFSLGSTRVIYDGRNNEATFSVINSAKDAPFLAQSWITAYDENDKTKPPFIITPPLYRQDNGKNTLRVVRSGGDLATDKESAYWLNVKAIPAGVKPSDQSNSLSFAYVLRIKLFYRPAGLAGNPSTAYKDLVFTRQGEKLIVKNPTPYHITLNKVSLGGENLKNISAMVPPLGQQTYELPHSAVSNVVRYQAVNDLGGVLPEENKKI